MCVACLGDRVVGLTGVQFSRGDFLCSLIFLRTGDWLQVRVASFLTFVDLRVVRYLFV